MLLSSFLLPLAAVQTVLASDTPDDESQRQLLKHPQCAPLDSYRYECPTCKPENWCNPLRCFKAPAESLVEVHTTFDIFSLIFGFEFPPNLKLCPVGKCDPTSCLCREAMIKRITAFLNYDGTGKSHGDDEL